MRCLTALLIPEFSFHLHLAPSHLRFDSLAFGMLLSYWYHRHPQAVSSLIEAQRLKLAFISFLLLAWCALVPRHTFIGHTLIQTAQYIGHGLLLLLAIVGHRFQWAYGTSIGRILQMIGRYSYSIYLWHMGVLVWSRTLISHLTGQAEFYGDLKVLTYAALVIPVGVVAAQLVEIPVLAIRDRFFPSRSEGLRTLATAGLNR
jgi:peptidoglycan/LPS O-acetylase OafA/YrhL